MKRNLGVQLFGCSKEFRVNPMEFFDNMKSFGINQIEPCILFDDPVVFKEQAIASGNEFAARLPELLWLPEEVEGFCSELAKRDMVLESAHVFAGDLLGSYEKMEELAKSCGIKSFVVNTPAYAHESPDEFVEILTELAKRLKAIGVELWLHNGGKDFVVKKELDGKDVFIYEYILKKAKGVFAQVDTGWVLPGGILPEDFIKENIDIIKGIHFKDMDKDFMNKTGLDIFAVLGQGCVNIPAVMAAVPKDMPVVMDQDASKGDFIMDLKNSALALKDYI